MVSLTVAQTGLVAGSVLIGAAMQRLTGLGFALVASPLLVLLLGPLQGVLLANALTLVINVVVLAGTWRDVDLRRVALLVAPALVAVQLGAPVARLVPAPVLMAVIGGAVLVALLAVVLLRGVVLFPGRGGAIAAGGLSGFMNVTAGVGGPAITLYAAGALWPQARFVASMQLYFGMMNAGSILAKGLPHLPVALVPALGAALGLGIIAGEGLARVVSASRARQAVLALAVLGSAATMLKGIAAL